MTSFDDDYSEPDTKERHARIIGYSNAGPLYSRPVPYRHQAISNRGELGTAFPRIEKEESQSRLAKED